MKTILSLLPTDFSIIETVAVIILFILFGGCLLVIVGFSLYVAYLWFTKPKKSNECPECKMALTMRGKLKSGNDTILNGYCPSCRYTFCRSTPSDQQRGSLFDSRWEKTS